MKNLDFTEEEIKKGKVLAVLSYINILSLFTLLISNNKYVMFHAKQGIRLMIVYSITLGILFTISKLIPALWGIMDILIGIVILISISLSLMGISDSIKGKNNELFFINKIFKRKESVK